MAIGLLGATVIGVSHDKIETPSRLSVSECRSKFAVAADEDRSIMKSYDAVLSIMPRYADRMSYLIAPDGGVLYAYTLLDPDIHVANTLAALRKWSAQQKQQVYTTYQQVYTTYLMLSTGYFEPSTSSSAQS